MSANGRLPRSELAPIAGGWLRKDAAAAWNAMNAESRERYGVTLLPMGSMSSYRTYDQQVYLWNTVPHAHDPNWVAVPGTSNHGLGLAVDLASPRMRQVINAIGAKYGFTKGCSDAQLEWWHIKYNPGCTGATWHGRDVGPYGHGSTHADPLKGLTKAERQWVERLEYHRRGMRHEEKTGRGAKWRRHLKWARYYKSRIKTQMRQLRRDAEKKGGGGWKKDHRGHRYQLLKKAYHRKLKL